LRVGGYEVVGIVTDVSDPDSVERLKDEALNRFGRVNLVCNNAGVGGAMTLGHHVDLADWRWVMGVNLWGVVNGHRSFLPHLLEHGDGYIVNTASMSGHWPGNSPYSASKWAVVSITEGLFNQLRSQGSTIGVSCLCPGFVATNFGTSERNRPDWARPETPLVASEMQSAAQKMMLERLAAGMSPVRVAELVHDAVVEERFWVFTDDDLVAGLESRYQAILAGKDPPTLELG
jgi:NAD(P)-dependent dehydrogenase (short-subunit alcohol dehydrogenase family)